MRPRTPSSGIWRWCWQWWRLWFWNNFIRMCFAAMSALSVQSFPTVFNSYMCVWWIQDGVVDIIMLWQNVFANAWHMCYEFNSNDCCKYLNVFAFLYGWACNFQTRALNIFEFIFYLTKTFNNRVLFLNNLTTLYNDLCDHVLYCILFV